ncbi:tRNA (adenosine(37)-N6)-threonylcarbamoyltransferase complex ATPase subunit type 1 TsaE [uncultured Desulfuromusa sp.]|uniref:tRNA (adenosine(37)-N6)-threonylcarbamoyltransferase complex ATPase subunit type 1 TsaE n=1 Tax=uncultured Desulfuromusa sp. TaxID=219183 RepID=UPI002AA6FBF1|nr:tRNA (adenosine(37)-N6)-threonylcarbamoyltransferase complex ATPase subunit type 1 TsaE [uncultured Desulfuromusa sp.]
MHLLSVVSDEESQTLELGEKLGRLLEQPVRILLQGDLGVGKTVFARGVARGLGVDPQIPITSPTFTLMNHYSARLDLYHFDLYRLSEPDELIELGFDEYAYGSGVALIEWPEKLDNLETPGLWVTLTRISAVQREISMRLQGDNLEELTAALQDLCR